MHRSRGYPRVVFALVPAAIALVAAMNLDVPYYSISPGPAQDVERLISVQGAPTHQLQGKLLLTTVSLRSVSVVDAIRGWIDPVVSVVPRSEIVPPGTSERQTDKINIQEMEESKRDAAAAALSFLGYPVRIGGAGARVDLVLKGTPAASVLKVGDVIESVDATPVPDANDLVVQVHKHKIGEELQLRLLRDGVERDLRLRTVRSTEEPDAPMIGVQVRTASGTIDLPLQVQIRSLGIGGPSAGLMFALGVVDLLQSGDLTKGRAVAGTGVISPSGQVGQVGGVAQKVAAAERAGAVVFLVPTAELDDAGRGARHLRVVPVGTLADAVRVLQELGPPVRASGR